MLLRSRLTWLACLFLACVAQSAWADPPADPLRLIPAHADVVVKLENARQLFETVYELEALKELQKFDVVKEYYNSTNVKRFNQLIEYFEKKVGAKKYELMDKLTGGGVAIGLKIDAKPKVVAVIEGTDEKATQVFVAAALELIEQELARQQKKEKITKSSYANSDIYNLGPEFHLAQLGATIILANDKNALKASLDLHQGKGSASILSNKSLQQARKMLPAKLLAWGWVNLNTVHKIPETKEFFETPEKVAQTNVTFFGGFIDVAKRSPFACFGLDHKNNQFTLSVQFPKGTKGMSEKVGGWFPAKGSSLPLLTPPNTLSSTSYNLDLAQFWKNREKLLLPQELKGLESADKESGKFLAGVKMSELFLMSGAHQRVVITQPTKSLYQRKPKTAVQAFAVVHEMRDPDMAKKLDRVIRIGAVLLTTQFNLEMLEEDYKGVPVVTYKFPEDKDFKGDIQDIRFGFSPSYAWVGNQFIGSSTLELCKDLIVELQKEKNPKATPAMFRSKAYSTGIAAALKGAEQEFLTQFVLAQGISLDKAKQEFSTLAQMLESFGTAQFDTLYTPNQLKVNFTLKLGK